MSVVGLLLLAVILNYTRAGSGINQRPYGNVYTSAPGTIGPSVLSHDESAARRLTRGTRQRRGRAPEGLGLIAAG